MEEGELMWSCLFENRLTEKVLFDSEEQFRSVQVGDVAAHRWGLDFPYGPITDGSPIY